MTTQTRYTAIDPKFVEPESRDQAKQRITQLATDVTAIQTQLGEAERTDSAGRVLTPYEFQQWRKQAKFALFAKLRELRALKIWLADSRLESEDQQFTDAKRIIIESAAKLCKAIRAFENDYYLPESVTNAADDTERALAMLRSLIDQQRERGY